MMPNISDVNSILIEWSECPFASHYMARKHYPEIDYEPLLNVFLSKINQFDCFQIGGWRPNENALSDVIAAILDPSWQHNWAVPALNALLQLISSKATEPNTRKVATSILSLDAAMKKRFKVLRETVGESSRSDIEILGSDFLICIEHKIRSGRETIIADKYQTDRLLIDAREKAGSLYIDPTRVIGILLSPEGTKAKNAEFLSLNYKEFIDALVSGIQPNDYAAISIRAFLNFCEGTF